MVLLLIFIVGLIFLAMAFFLKERSADSLLAGYNTMTDTEKESIELVPLLGFLKKFNIFVGVSVIIIGIALFYLTNNLVTLLFTINYPILAQVYFMVKSKKFYPSEYTTDDETIIFLLFGTLFFSVAIIAISTFI